MVYHLTIGQWLDYEMKHWFIWKKKEIDGAVYLTSLPQTLIKIIYRESYTAFAPRLSKQTLSTITKIVSYTCITFSHCVFLSIWSRKASKYLPIPIISDGASQNQYSQMSTARSETHFHIQFHFSRVIEFHDRWQIQNRVFLTGELGFQVALIFSKKDKWNINFEVKLHIFWVLS